MTRLNQMPFSFYGFLLASVAKYFKYWVKRLPVENGFSSI